MASVYNSTSGSSPFTGQWEDVQSYTSVITTIKSALADTITVNVQWVNSVDDSPPEPHDRPLVIDSFVTDGTGFLTKEYSTRCRWVRVTVTGGASSFRLATTYKKAPTEIKLTDDTTNIVSVNLGDTNNSLYTVLSDMSGATLRSTGAEQTGSSLYTHLADGSGNSLATTETYRFITLHDTSHYDFTATDEANSAATSNTNTVIFHEGTLRLAVDKIGVLDGDIVQFVMLRSNDTRNSGIGTAPNLFDTYTVSGHIKVTGKIQYVSADASFARVRILTQTNTSDWFNPAVGFNAIGSIRSYDTMADNHWVGQNGNIYYFKDSSGGSYFPVPDDLYNIIADVSGFNSSGAGISLAAGDSYQYPLDPRLIRWSNNARDLDGSGTAIMKVLIPANTKESLCVALRDSCNNNLASTGAGVTTYRVDNRNTVVPHVLYFVDGTDHYPGTAQSGTSKLKNILGNLVVNIAKDLPTTSRGTVIIYDVSTSAVGQGISALVDSLSIGGGETGDLTTAVISTVSALSDVSMGDYWSVLSAFAQKRVGGLNTSINASHNTVVLVSGYNSDGSLEREDQGFDASFNSYYGNMRRIAVSNYLSPDMLNFTGGNSDNFYLLTQSMLNDNSTDISVYARSIAQKLTKSAFVGHNALSVHTSDAKGHSQAATGRVTEAVFGDVALYYSLADSCGSAISTYQTKRDVCNNALYVTLADGSGVSISHDNGLYIAMDSKFISSHGFDLSIGGKLVTLHDISSVNVDVSVVGFNINNLNIANESAVPVWVKVYDICAGMVKAGGTGDLTVGPSAEGLLPYLKYNFAIPPTNYRDLQFSKPVLFNNGIYFAASTNFRYDSLEYPPGRAPLFITGNYTHVSQ